MSRQRARWHRVRLAGTALIAALIGAGTSILAGGPAEAAVPSRAPAVIAAYYYPPFGLPVSSIPASHLTDLIYSFAEINAHGQCYLPDSAQAAKDFAGLAALKRRYPALKTEISIGGTGDFSDAALTQQSRAHLIASCVSLFFRTYSGAFDGIDLDWEFPVSGGPANLTSRPADRRDFTLLLRQFRSALNVAGRQRHEHLLLTAALPAGRLQSDGLYDPSTSYQLAAVARLLDWVNLMTYDFVDGYSTVSGFDAPMWPSPSDPTPEVVKRWNSVATAVDYYELKGVPADKIVLGEPFFSLAFTVASASHDGLYQRITGFAAPPSWTDIESSLLKNRAWSRHWSQTAQAPWLFDAATKTFVTYDDPASLRIKSEFARLRGLRGVFTWAIDQDDAQSRLLDAMSGPFQ
jgi:chitinase